MKAALPLLLLFPFILFLDACKKLPNDGIPFYMQMDSVQVTNSTTQNITDVWVEANSSNIGAFELPCNYPVLEEGTVRFLVSAGIWVSGQAGVRDIYPFYNPDTFTIVARRGEQYHHKPVFTYKPATIIVFNDEQIDFSVAYDSMKLCTDANAIYGGRCGQLTVTETDTDVIAVQNLQYSLPTGQESWLEIDYKADVPFWIGIDAHNPNGRAPVLFVVPVAEWNKIYLKLSDLISSVRANSYNLYFEAEKPVGGNPGSVYLDNIKLVHF